MSAPLSGTQRQLRPYRALCLAVMAFLPLGPAWAAEEADDPWPDLRDTLFQERPIAEGDGIIHMEAPYRAYDAAIVPISIVAEIPQSQERYIKSITLIVDKNPAPVAAVFNMTPLSGSATISTRVRVNEYSHVRAIAETNDGALFMAAKYVKAAGGCSAPALKDKEKAMARMGRLKLKQSKHAEASVPNEVQLLISHPNYSGFQMDQLTRYYIPAHFVQDIEITYGGRTVMTVEGAISLSEDPSIHFSYVPEGPGELSVTVRDSEERVYEGQWPVSMPQGS